MIRFIGLRNLRLINNNNFLFSRKKNFSKNQPKLQTQKILQKQLQQLNKNDKSNSNSKFKQKINQSDRKIRSLKARLMFLTATGLLLVLFAQNDNPKDNLQSNKSIESSLMQQDKFSKGFVRIIPTPQALTRFLAGQFLQQIVIERGFYKQQGGRFITTCKMLDRQGVPFITGVQHLQIFLQTLQKAPIDYKIKFQYKSPSQKATEQAEQLAKYITYLLIAAGVAAAISIRNKFKNSSTLSQMMDPTRGLFNTKSFKPIQPQKIQTKFADVAGMHEAKSQITQFVDFLKVPERYIDMGAKVPKGALLTGPPGTGKTLIAKACAGQAGVPFFYVSGSDFVEKYVGLGANRVRQLFNEAQKVSPSIIFIDQIDAIGKKRDSGPFSNEQKDNTLNQLLVKMDGFDSQNKVIVMGATNRKDMLDPALLRPGRFDRTVQISLPNYQQRKQILKVHLKKVKFSQKLTIQEVANKVSVLTPGFSGAQLANVCNEAAIQAARLNMDSIQIQQFQKAVQRVLAGLQKRNMFSNQQKQMLAYYQSGKAVIGWFIQGADPLVKISILPFSKKNKGYSHVIKDEHSLSTKQQLLAKACSYLAGRASQIYFKGYISTNGDEDLKRAKKIINYMVMKFGMSQKLRMIAFPDIEFVRKPYSQKVQKTIDEQMSLILDECKQRVEKMVLEKKQKIQEVTRLLLEKQTLSHNQIEQILGKRPFEANSNYSAFLAQQQKQNQEDQKNQKKQEPKQLTQQQASNNKKQDK